MPRQSLFDPLGILVAGLVVIVVLIVIPDMARDVTARRQIGVEQIAQDTSDCPYYPNTTTTAIPDRCLALTKTVTATSSSGTRTPTVTGTPATATLVGRSTATALSRGTPTDTLTITVFPTVRPTNTFTSNVPRQATRTPGMVPTLIPTATPHGDLLCRPGVPIEIVGEGTPRTPFLLYFGERAVSGGSVDARGHFAIALVVGNERAGNYVVTVRARGSGRLLHRLTCSVPVATPTPRPTSRVPIRR